LTAGDLVLDLLAECQGVGDLFEDFGSAAGAADYDRAIAEHSPHGRLFYSDAFNSRQEQLNGAAARQASLYNHSLISQRHFGGVAPNEANSKEDSSNDKCRESEPNQDAGMRFGGVRGAPGKHEKGDAGSHEKRSKTCVPEHDDPVEIGLILDRFTWDEVFVNVTQSGSSKLRGISGA
jgi:hypothetical protein